MRLYMLVKLPVAWFAGMQVVSCDEHKTVVRLPYGWRSQNPFRSVYFAAQCGAAEMSTGLMALAQLQERPPMSMLVTKIEAQFFKKASEPILFTCDQGKEIAAAIERALETQEAQQFVATSTGRLPDGAIASEVKITWSFKTKNN